MVGATVQNAGRLIDGDVVVVVPFERVAGQVSDLHHIADGRGVRKINTVKCIINDAASGSRRWYQVQRTVVEGGRLVGVCRRNGRRPTVAGTFDVADQGKRTGRFTPLPSIDSTIAGDKVRHVGRHVVGHRGGIDRKITDQCLFARIQINREQLAAKVGC
ncbi:hypothetical protein Pla22_28800 [Rubripirellula amarantea]|uniref:Uncharacterized protein n=1 Tax=Rubripirellula amarantea TaxID=2527999 RepID=A0A5C5WHK5_9BACT|nr:hypothetical protein Pla22_28800 [Rubripirellula amarantea]